MTFEEFWKENYEKEFGTCEPYCGIASYAFEKGQENCNCVHTDNSKVIERLEKENAELKEKNNNLVESSKTIISLTDEIEARTMEQLTKAVGLIKDFLLMAKVEHLKERYETVSEAEQFLKKVSE